MDLCHTLLMNLTFLFIIFLILVESSDWRYETCKPRNCGSGTEIRYPFYIEDQNATYDSPCGYPGFEVCCVDNKPMFTTSSGQFVLTSISYENRTFHLVDVDVFNSTTTCKKPSFFAFDRSSFNFGPDVISLCLLYGCNSTTFKYVENPIECASNGSYRAYAVLDNGYEIQCDELPCESYVAGPIDISGGSNVSAESEIGNYTKLLENGFTLTWEGHDCHECEKSGGYCGFDGNTTMCYCPEKPHSFTCKNGKSKLGVILGTVGGGLFMLMSILVAYLVWRRKKVIDEVLYIHSSRMPEPSLEQSSDIIAEAESVFFGVPVFSYTELELITNNFNESNELGYGGFGTVYYGKLKDGREVAIKYLYGHNYKTLQQFKNELEILTRLRHRNLVSLYGCTSKRSRELLLVYEYIPNGTVADHLHGNRRKDRSLSWYVRMNIAIETAVALAYLHASDIIHRDVKTNNILLDHNFCVKVADFGLSRLFPNDMTHVSTAPQGTPGYVDPEYYQCYQLTDKSDVYSFGVVLIELMSSLPAVDMNRPSNDINLASFAVSRIHRRAFTELIDPSLRIETDPEAKRMSKSVSELAFRCLQHDKDMRPTMEEVAEGLKVIQSNKGNVFMAKSPDSDHHVVLLKKDVKLPSSPTSVADTWTSGSSVSTTSR